MHCNFTLYRNWNLFGSNSVYVKAVRINVMYIKIDLLKKTKHFFLPGPFKIDPLLFPDSHVRTVDDNFKKKQNILAYI